jgi:hypothetical protein
MVMTAALLAAGTSFAQPVSDATSGLAVDPPAPFTAKPGKPHRQYDVTFDIEGAGDAPRIVQPDGRLCSVGFKNAPQNAGLSKAEINAMVGKPEWRNLYKATFELIGTVTPPRSFSHQGYQGVELTVTPKTGPNAADIRMYAASIETAKGRTALICVTDAASLNAALPKFRAIRAGIRAPE